MNITKYVSDWFLRAEEDLRAVKILLQKEGSLNLACFHSQQAAEKYLKGFLAYHEKHVRKIHDLSVLLEGCKSIDSSFAEIESETNFLNQFYTESRYPDDYAEFGLEEAEKAHETALRVKNFVLKKIKPEEAI